MIVHQNAGGRELILNEGSGAQIARLTFADASAAQRYREELQKLLEQFDQPPQTHFGDPPEFKLIRRWICPRCSWSRGVHTSPDRPPSVVPTLAERTCNNCNEEMVQLLFDPLAEPSRPEEPQSSPESQAPRPIRQWRCSHCGWGRSAYAGTVTQKERTCDNCENEMVQLPGGTPVDPLELCGAPMLTREEHLLLETGDWMRIPFTQLPAAFQKWTVPNKSAWLHFSQPAGWLRRQIDGLLFATKVLPATPSRPQKTLWSAWDPLQHKMVVMDMHFDAVATVVENHSHNRALTAVLRGMFEQIARDPEGRPRTYPLPADEEKA